MQFFLKNDIKLIINSLSNVVKSFTALIKLNRIKLADSINKDDLNINNWCIRIFANLKSKFDEFQQKALTLPASGTESTFLLTENRIKFFVLETQFSLYIIQNVFEFELM